MPAIQPQACEDAAQFLQRTFAQAVARAGPRPDGRSLAKPATAAKGANLQSVTRSQNQAQMLQREL